MSPDDGQVEEETSADGKSGDDICLRLVIPSAVAPRYTPRDQPPPHPEATPLVAAGSPAKDLLHISGEVTSSTRYDIKMDTLSVHHAYATSSHWI